MRRIYGKIYDFEVGADRSVRDDTMKPRIFRMIQIVSMPLGNYRSLPTEMGSAAPMYPVKEPRPLEHPQDIVATVDVGMPPMEPLNGSTLATQCPPESEAAAPAGYEAS